MVTLIQQQKLEEKSKTKKDGIYTYQGIYYKVIGNKLHYMASHGEVLQCFGHFNVVVGSYSGYSDAAKKVLKDLS